MNNNFTAVYFRAWQLHVVAENSISLPAKILILHWLSSPWSIKPRSCSEIQGCPQGIWFSYYTQYTKQVVFCEFAFGRMDNSWSKGREVLINQCLWNIHCISVFFPGLLSGKLNKESLKIHLVPGWQGTL